MSDAPPPAWLRGCWSLLIALAAFAPSPASADERSDKLACIEHHRAAQVLRQDTKLRASRERLSACAAASCPAIVRADCARWLAELDAEQPTLVIRAFRGDTVIDAVRVSIDGAPLVESLKGKAIEVDPGEHIFRFEHAGEHLEERVTIHTGEKARMLRVDFVDRAQREPALTARSAGPSPWTWVLGGFALAGLGSFVTFALVGDAHEDRLADRCAPNCSRSDVIALDREYLAADISLGVGIVATCAAALVGITSSQRAPRKPDLAILAW